MLKDVFCMPFPIPISVPGRIHNVDFCICRIKGNLALETNVFNDCSFGCFIKINLSLAIAIVY
jgi:hypothetical protein